MPNDSELFYICEQTSPENPEPVNYKRHNEGDVWWLEFLACIHEFGIMGLNGRGYLEDNCVQNVFSPKNKYRMAHNGWFGEQDHPWPHKEGEKLTRKRITSIFWPNRSHCVINPYARNGKLYATIQTTPATEAGRGMALDMVRGMIPSFSARTIGYQQLIKGKPYIITTIIATYDLVDYPAFGEADAKSNPVAKSAGIPFAESAENGLANAIPLTEIINDVAESDGKVNSYMEAYDMDVPNVVGFTDDHESMIVSPKSDRYIYVGLNKRSVDMVRDFYRSF